MAAKKELALSLAELEALAPEAVDEPTARKIATVYAEAKDIYVRGLCLRLLYDKPGASQEGRRASARRLLPRRQLPFARIKDRR